VPHHADDYVHRIGRTGRAGRAGTAISIVGPLDYKSIAAIEKLIGQTIPRMDIDLESHAGVAAASGEETEQPRESRGRSETRDGARHAGGESRGGRKPRREREPRRSGSNRQSEPKTHAPRNPAPVAAFTPPVAPQPSRTPSIGREPAPHSRDSSSEPADHSHLPAFLLRPVRARV
jgi:superfamily II DNA/RNA helicase